jgi:putative endonuclease
MIATKAGVPWKMVWSQSFETRAEAFQKEREIKKKKSRKYIQWLIDSSDVG